MVRSAKCLFCKKSVRQNVRRQNIRSAKCLSAKCLSAKSLSVKCPGTQRTCPNMQRFRALSYVKKFKTIFHVQALFPCPVPESLLSQDIMHGVFCKLRRFQIVLKNPNTYNNGYNTIKNPKKLRMGNGAKIFTQTLL